MAARLMLLAALLLLAGAPRLISPPPAPSIFAEAGEWWKQHHPKHFRPQHHLAQQQQQRPQGRAPWQPRQPPPPPPTPPPPPPPPPPARLERLNGGRPIIFPALFPSYPRDTAPQASSCEECEWGNINGPSLLRLPDWLPASQRADPQAQYYLYFAHHNHPYLRLAWSPTLANGGLWTLYAGPSASARGVMDLGPSKRLAFANGLVIFGHVASPDVHIDHKNRRFELFFHAFTNTAASAEHHFHTDNQKTLVAYSLTGLNFNPPPGAAVRGGMLVGEPGGGPRPHVLGNAYFRVFSLDGRRFAFSNKGVVWRAPAGWDGWGELEAEGAKAMPSSFSDSESDPDVNSALLDTWEEGPAQDSPVFAALSAAYGKLTTCRGQVGASAGGGSTRHFAVYVDTNANPATPTSSTLELWYSAIGDAPERIFHTRVLQATAAGWRDWRAETTNAQCLHDEWLRPALLWEGVHRPVLRSRSGYAVGVHELRDPAFFLNPLDGARYLLYTGGGEEGIGIARFIDEEAVGAEPEAGGERTVEGARADTSSKEVPEVLAEEVEEELEERIGEAPGRKEAEQPLEQSSSSSTLLFSPGVLAVCLLTASAAVLLLWRALPTSEGKRRGRPSGVAPDPGEK